MDAEMNTCIIRYTKQKYVAENLCNIWGGGNNMYKMIKIELITI